MQLDDAKLGKSRCVRERASRPAAAYSLEHMGCAASRSPSGNLMSAAESCKVEAVRALLAEGVADVEYKDSSSGYTALGVAAMRGHVEVVKLLVDAGANVNAGADQGISTPLILACRKGGAYIHGVPLGTDGL